MWNAPALRSSRSWSASAIDYQVLHDRWPSDVFSDARDKWFAGGSREAVARVLHDLRCAALVETTRRGVVLLDAVQLDAEAAL